MESQNQKEPIEISLNSAIWSFQKTNTEEWKKQNIYKHPIKEKVQKFNIELFEANQKKEDCYFSRLPGIIFTQIIFQKAMINILLLDG